MESGWSDDFRSAVLAGQRNCTCTGTTARSSTGTLYSNARSTTSSSTTIHSPVVYVCTQLYSCTTVLTIILHSTALTRGAAAAHASTIKLLMQSRPIDRPASGRVAPASGTESSPAAAAVRATATATATTTSTPCAARTQRASGCVWAAWAGGQLCWAAVGLRRSGRWGVRRWEGGVRGKRVAGPRVARTERRLRTVGRSRWLVQDGAERAGRQAIERVACAWAARRPAPLRPGGRERQRCSTTRSFGR